MLLSTHLAVFRLAAKTKVAADLEDQHQISKMASDAKGGSHASHPASRGEPGLQTHLPTPASGHFSLRKKSPGRQAQDSTLRLDLARKWAAPTHARQKTTCLWQLFLLKVKIPLSVGKNLIKTERKAQLPSTWASIYNLGEGISHRFNSYMKKNQLLRGGCVSHFLFAFVF